jgi:two-component system, NtrC family, sensor kinase
LARTPRGNEPDGLWFDFPRLFHQSPEITEAVLVGKDGREQIAVSRISIDVLGSGKDYTDSDKFQLSRTNGRYFSPVYFRRGSEPYLSMALLGSGRDKSVTIAEINLKFVWDVVSRIDDGGAGRAFVGDSNGHLIAHPGISLVLRKTDLSTLPQVIAARTAPEVTGVTAMGGITRGLGGSHVLPAP